MLRRRNICAVGAVECDPKKFPEQLATNVNKQWMFPCQSVTSGDSKVLTMLWKGSPSVCLLTTAHTTPKDIEVNAHGDQQESADHDESTSTAALRGNKPKAKSLAIPKAVEDLQRNLSQREVYSQLKSDHLPVNEWMPLFRWLLETAVTNSYVLAIE